MNIEEFKKIAKPKNNSKLKKYKAEILQLHKDNYSLKSIVHFLKKNGIQTTFQNVAKFIKTHNKNTVAIPKMKTNSSKAQQNQASKSFPKFEKVGKDLDLKEAPGWAN